MAHSIRQIVIVGAGQAAAQAVVSLRRLGFDGRVVMVGEEEHLPYHRPPLSKAYLAGEIGVDRLPIRARTFYTDRDVDCRPGTRVRSIDRAARSVLSDDGAIEYDKLLLATGGRARELRLAQGVLPARVFSLRSVADVDRIRAALVENTRVVIVGGGYVGLEAAAVLTKLGCRVTLLEAMERLLARVAPQIISEFYADEHRRHGVAVLTDIQVDAIVDNEGQTTVHAGARSWPADLVLVSVGLVPNMELAQNAGLECGNGVLVDQQCRSSDQNIFAAGDVAARRDDGGAGLRLESVQNAIWQGKCAAAAMLGAEPVAPEVPWFWSDQYDVKLQIAGLAGPDDAWLVRGDPARPGFVVFSLRDGVMTSATCVNSPRDFMRSKKLILEGAPLDAGMLADPSVPL